MKLLLITLAAMTLAGCSGSSSSPNPSDAKLTGTTGDSTAASTGGSLPTGPLQPVANYICASLSGAASEMGCSNPHLGLAGSIYALASDPPAGVQPNIGYILTQGVLVANNLRMGDFDVPTRNFTEGFPKSDGTLLLGPNQQPLIAFFALDLKGFLTLGAPYASGAYQFAFFVDDGAILTLDQQSVLNFDGYHSPQWACAPSPVSLNLGEPHPLHLQYFQGPPTQIALRVMMRPWNAGQPCSDLGGFLPVPASFLNN